MQRARNRRGTQGHNIYLSPQPLKTFFMRDAELVLFVNDHKAKILKVNIFLKQPMRSDDDVYTAVGNFLNNFFLLTICPESGQHVN